MKKANGSYKIPWSSHLYNWLNKAVKGYYSRSYCHARCIEDFVGRTIELFLNLWLKVWKKVEGSEMLKTSRKDRSGVGHARRNSSVEEIAAK